MGTKLCYKCGEDKPLDDFALERRAKSGRQSRCRSCMSEYDAGRAALNRERYLRDKEKMSDQYRLRTYGLSREEYDQMLLEHDGECGICFQPFSETPHIDHCHATGENRGLLCRDCNFAIGLMRDNPLRLQSAIHYLEKYATLATV